MSAERSLFDRFWEKVAVRADDDCWLWLAARKGWPYEYGIIGVRGHLTTGAHRVSWMLANGREVPDDLWVLHHCDNGLCVNPKHLFLGTRQDNVDDMMSKRRHWAQTQRGNPARGERQGSAKLTAAEVCVIRQRREAGETCQSIASSFGVSRRLVGMIARRQIWKHV